MKEFSTKVARWAVSMVMLSCVILTPRPSTAGGLAKMHLQKKETELLDGRLTIRLPRRARVEPRKSSIMGAPKSSEDETRVVIETGKQKMVLMAFELFATGGADFDRSVREMLGEGEGDYEIKRLELGHPALYGVATVPTRFDNSADANLVLGLYLANRDDTVQFMGVYVNPEGARDPEGVRELALKMVSTVKPGRRSLDADGGPTRMGPVQIDLPEGYVTTARQGPDFTVHSVRKLVPLGATAPTLGVYLGMHPAWHHERQGATFETLTTPLFGKDREWHRWRTDTATILETISPMASGPSVAHVFLTAEDDASMAELKKIAGTLKVVDSP